MKPAPMPALIGKGWRSKQVVYPAGFRRLIYIFLFPRFNGVKCLRVDFASAFPLKAHPQYLLTVVSFPPVSLKVIL